MNDKVWKLQEIPEVCPEYIVDEAEVYVKAMQNKSDRIKFLVERLSKLEKTQPNNRQEFSLLQLEVVIYIESIATNLHSLADVFAHVINVIVLKPLQSSSDNDHLSSKKICSRKISIGTVNKELKKFSSLDEVRGGYIKTITDGIDELLSLSEFKYIASFVNTIKHRNLVETDFHSHSQDGKWIYRGFRLDPFVYDNIHYDQRSCETIVMEYREKVMDKIFDIGNNINNYLRQVG